ncbi:unnamed protein product [Callosobruchus maculatus]|uniref:Golgi resident protein GCP60 n=1 Tax=Callosobruchus maculatus TaxID=64391 RepID=A0A653DH00_CALMS|nr:unnamed protein product [Callosobruchus maculatus]
MSAELAVNETLAKLDNSLKTNGEVVDNNEGIEYGLPLQEVYKLAFNFYKEKEGKAFHFSYEDKLQLVAFSQQVVHGPYTDAIHKLPALGTLDVVGRDRRIAWQKLGQLSADQARTGFVELISRRCPLFFTYVEAHRREKKEQERKIKEEESKKLIEAQEKQKKEEEEKFLQEQLYRQEAIKRQIQQALNEQTYSQFRKYAEQQYPGDPQKQGNLIKQLQEQHYIQYIQQLQVAQREQKSSDSNTETPEKEHIDIKNDLNIETEPEEEKESEPEEQGIVAASMWTRSEIEAFKQSVAKGEGDGVVRVGHGETVTVRVPTHPHGSRLFWEFATDHYDIGFGVYFEFGTPTTEEVSVHVSESDDEDLDDMDDEIFDDEAIRTNDLESGSLTANGFSKPLLHEIVPVYRRDCQSEVYAGSHPYPGRGVYLLKFDNSYSLWRSKTLYYRVYYSH